MKKYLPMLVASGVLMFSFQNCSQQQSNLLADANSASQTKINDPVLSQAQSIDIFTQADQKVSLNLATGELAQMSAGSMQRKCLPDSIRGEIQDILANSNLCETQEPSVGMACAQIYAPAYSELHWADKSIKVGEAFSSCHKDVDLCGQDGMLLRGILRDVVSRWDEWSCDFRDVSQVK